MTIVVTSSEPDREDVIPLAPTLASETGPTVQPWLHARDDLLVTQRIQMLASGYELKGESLTTLDGHGGPFPDIDDGKRLGRLPVKSTPQQVGARFEPGDDDDDDGRERLDSDPSTAPGAADSSSDGLRHCTSDKECVKPAECVYVVDGKRVCICTGEAVWPDPVTGGCPPTITSGVDWPNPDGKATDPKVGLILNDSFDSIRNSTPNTTGGIHMNGTVSILRHLTNDAATSTPLTYILAPIFCSFLIVIVAVIVVFIYRRRFLNKQMCVKRGGESHVRTNDGVMLLDRMNNINKNPTYFYPNGATSRKHNVKEVALEKLKLMEVVGEGAFGQVFKGELQCPDTGSCTQVAIKVLKDGASHEAQEDFDREVEIMATFDHDNILKLLGIVVQGTDGSPYMIFEYMDHGDLSELLRRNDPHFQPSHRKGILLNKTDLVDVSVQIANGMSYLSAQRFVHRDLATRNCLVGSGLIVKISDFGMSRDVYTNDYYRIGGSRMLPVRWMSPEAIKYGRFTCESDIWAYGVVLWEIFSFGKQPYCGHTNEEVIHFLDQGILLQRPEECPSTVYHVMLGCWKKDPRQRIVFERLVKYLTDYRNRLNRQVHSQPQQPQTILVDVLGPAKSIQEDTGASPALVKLLGVDDVSEPGAFRDACCPAGGLGWTEAGATDLDCSTRPEQTTGRTSQGEQRFEGCQGVRGNGLERPTGLFLDEVTSRSVDFRPRDFTVSFDGVKMETIDEASPVGYDSSVGSSTLLIPDTQPGSLASASNDDDTAACTIYTAIAVHKTDAPDTTPMRNTLDNTLPHTSPNLCPITYTQISSESLHKETTYGYRDVPFKPPSEHVPSCVTSLNTDPDAFEKKQRDSTTISAIGLRWCPVTQLSRGEISDSSRHSGTVQNATEMSEQILFLGKPEFNVFSPQS